MKQRPLLVTCMVLALASAALGRQAAAPSAAATARITKEVRHELLMLPYFSVFDNLSYKVDGYKVTLMGQVTKPTLKSDAGNVVKRIEGVEEVDNQIEVLPLSPNDDRIRRALYRSIYGYGPLQKYALGVQQPIRIIVKNGNATLEGVVDNEGDKDVANIRAKSVPGVFSVTNNLQVASNRIFYDLKAGRLERGFNGRLEAEEAGVVRLVEPPSCRCRNRCGVGISTSLPKHGTCRLSGGAPLRRRWVAPITASTTSDSSALRGTKILCMFERKSGGLIRKPSAVVRLRSLGIMPSRTSLSLNLSLIQSPSVRGRLVKVLRLSSSESPNSRTK